MTTRFLQHCALRIAHCLRWAVPIVALSAAIAHGQAPQGQPAPRYASKLIIHDLARGSSKMVHQADVVWEAPNWSRDGKFLLSNSGGKLYRISVDGGTTPEPIALDPSIRSNNDHDFSPDGKLLAISASSPDSRQSQIYVANADGSSHRLIVSAAPSYFHGWSPDGKYLSFVANRDGKQYDLYRVPSAGGQEERLTSDPAYDDGTDYSPDGKWIYFNSNRGGGWNIWRMPADGAGPNDKFAERITGDDLEDWFPHPSPDGRWLLFLSFPHGTEGHNSRGLQVQLRILPMPGNAAPEKTEPKTLLEFTGGQGTINVNSWATDSKRFAYVTYTALPPDPGK
jgi:dipeptidyl aminopeptidase/acylaminoacyl peptidase